MGEVTYILCTCVCLVCAILLLRGYSRGGHRLLLWSGLCFVGLFVGDLLVFLDLVIFPKIDLYPLRLVVGAISMLVLLFGLIWEDE